MAYKTYKVKERDAFTGRFRTIYETDRPRWALLEKKGKIGELKGKSKYKIEEIK